MIQLVICSPIPALRAGLRALIAADPDLEVAASVSGLDDLSGRALNAALVVATPDALPAGWETGAGLNRALPEPALLLVSDEVQDARALLNLGLPAWGVISPDAPAEALRAAIYALSEGLVAVSPALFQRALELPAGRPPGEDEAPDQAEHLTGRETEVLRCLAQGLTNKQIALALKISEHTVKFHVSSIYAKLDVTNRTEAGRKGARLGIVPL